MSYYFAVFSNRTQTMSFFRILKNYGCNISIINTPSNISSICSISIKFLPEDFDRVKKLLFRYNFSSFKGIYYYNASSWKGAVKKIY